MRRRAVLLRDGGGRLQAGHLAGQGAGTASPPAARPRPTSTATRPSGRPVPFASAAAPWRVRAVLAVTPRLPPTPPLRVEDLQRPAAQRAPVLALRLHSLRRQGPHVVRGVDLGPLCGTAACGRTRTAKSSTCNSTSRSPISLARHVLGLFSASGVRHVHVGNRTPACSLPARVGVRGNGLVAA